MKLSVLCNLYGNLSFDETLAKLTEMARRNVSCAASRKHTTSCAQTAFAERPRDVLRERKADQASRTPLSGALFGALKSNERRSDNIHFKTNE